MDPVGHGDRTEDLTSENYDENIRSENSVKILSGEGRDKEETLGRGHQDRTGKIAAASTQRYHQATVRILVWERQNRRQTTTPVAIGDVSRRLLVVS